MLKVADLVKNEVFSPRFFSLSGMNIDESAKFPLEEQHRDLLSLIMSLHYIECQEPLERKLVLETRFVDCFKTIKEDLEKLFLLLTGKSIELILRLAPAKGSQTVLNESKSEYPILFSGGVDSISGAIKVLSQNSKGILLHINSSKSIFGKVRKVIADEAFNKNLTYCINARIKAKRHRSFLSNTRGLLFLTAGYVVSKLLHCEKVVFCENGAQMLDIMMGSLAYDNAVTTLNTNPKYLQAINRLLCDFEGTRFTVDYTLKNKTKSEAISEFLNKGLLQKSWSCYSTRMRSEMCGSCWNCFTTSMSSVAAGYPGILSFEVDPLSEMLDSTFFSDNQRILYNMLVFYSKVINQDKKVLAELENYEDVFSDPTELATRFGLDLYLGISNCLSKDSRKNGLGRKAGELLSGIDNSLLLDRRESLARLRAH
jgi:7-cyano-7-deazaguanine synthase in queuosine biosynthesis